MERFLQQAEGMGGEEVQCKEKARGDRGEQTAEEIAACAAAEAGSPASREVCASGIAPPVQSASAPIFHLSREMI